MSACSFDPSGGRTGAGAADASPLAAGVDASPGRADATPGPAPDAALPAGALVSPSVVTGPILDGAIDAVWAQAPSVSYSITDAARTFGIHPSYGFDAAVSFRSLHDASRIYFLVEVTDDLLVDDSTQPYNDDAIELYLDGADDHAGPYGADDHWLVVRSSGQYRSYGPAAVALDDGAVLTTVDGYVVELSLARAGLGMSPGAATLGFDLGLVDDDDLGTTDADAYGLWFAPAASSCADCCEDQGQSAAWCDTSLLGSLILAD